MNNSKQYITTQKPPVSNIGIHRFLNTTSPVIGLLYIILFPFIGLIMGISIAGYWTVKSLVAMYRRASALSAHARP
jgi:hypothetical protein